MHETPGHAPSHVCLFQAERRVLISGDHLLGRVSLYFDFGFSPDPVGEFLGSLDTTDALNARLALSGHGRPFSDVREHHDGQPAARPQASRRRRGRARERPEHRLRPRSRWCMGTRSTPAFAAWLLTKMLCYLTHLEATGAVRRIVGEPERWASL